MSRQQLRQYVLDNPRDKQALYELSDRIKANSQLITIEELEERLKQG
jgi:hypothetical protein